MKPWLVIEDEHDIRMIVTMLFTAWGHPPMEFKSGYEAFEWLDQIEAGTFEGELPELALMDIRMPGHYGNKVARRMRTVGPLKHIPIVLMTAFNVTDSDKQKFYDEDGVDHLINKPLPEMDKLKTLLDDIHAKKTNVSDGDKNTPASGANEADSKPTT
ncbi:MAG: response regulator [Anaerolineae bacterium]|nr:response regulator [Anaerolineae bacterium]